MATAAVATGLAAGGLTVATTAMVNAIADDSARESLPRDVVAMNQRLRAVQSGDLARPSSSRDVLDADIFRYGDKDEAACPPRFLPAGTLAREEAARVEQDRARQDAKAGKTGSSAVTAESAMLGIEICEACRQHPLDCGST